MDPISTNKNLLPKEWFTPEVQVTDGFEANHKLIEGKSNAHLYRNFMSALGASSKAYSTPLNPIFISTAADDLEIFNKTKAWLARDGVIPLSWFFRKNPTPPKEFKGKLFIHKDLSDMVPKEWKRVVSTYGPISIGNPTQSKKLLIYASFSPITCGPANVIEKFHEFNQKRNLEKYEEILLFSPLTPTFLNHRLPYDINQISPQLISVQLSSIAPEKIKIISEKAIEELDSFENFEVLNLCNKIYCADDYLIHKLLTKNANLFGSTTTSIDEKNTVMASPFHGVKVYDLPKKGNSSTANKPKKELIPRPGYTLEDHLDQGYLPDSFPWLTSYNNWASNLWANGFTDFSSFDPPVYIDRNEYKLHDFLSGIGMDSWDYLGPIQSVYAHELFIKTEIANQSKRWLLKDGFINLLNFFANNPKPPKGLNTKLYISKKYSFLVPQHWKIFFGEYQIKSNKHCYKANSKVENLLLIISPEDLVSFGNSYIDHTSNELNTLIKGSNFNSVSVFIDWPDLFFDKNNTYNFLKKTFEAIKNVTGINPVEISYDQIRSTCDFSDTLLLNIKLPKLTDLPLCTHLILHRGGKSHIRFSPPTKKENELRLSPFHSLYLTENIPSSTNSELEQNFKNILPFSCDYFFKRCKDNIHHMYIWERGFEKRCIELLKSGENPLSLKNKFSIPKGSSKQNKFEQLTDISDRNLLSVTTPDYFSFMFLENIKAMFLQDKIVLNDGLIPLLWFFEKLKSPPPFLKGKIYIDEKFIDVVPASWKTSIGSHTLVSTISKNQKELNEIIIIGNINQSEINLQQMRQRLRKVNSMIDNDSTLSKSKLNVFIKVSQDPLDLHPSQNFYFDIVKLFIDELGTEISLIHSENFKQLSNWSTKMIFDLNRKIFVANTQSAKYALLSGARSNLPKVPANLKKKQFIQISENHGYLLKDNPKVANKLWRSEYEKLRHKLEDGKFIISEDIEFDPKSNDYPWPSWYLKWIMSTGLIDKLDL